MIHPEDTIAAIATAAGEGAISIVRLSGPRSLEIADSVFRGADPKPSARLTHVVVHGHIPGDDGDIDEVLLAIMRAPNSYTGEDVVEIQGHGGSVSARRTLRRVLDAGARPAEPGEFTRRAFLNGRMDLVQAEAVLDLVRAKSDRAASAAVEQLEGALSRRFNGLYDDVMAIASDLEASLDFPEDELPATAPADLLSRLASAERLVDELIATWDEGHLLREGALVVISGRTNVGKSTMLNTLLGRHRAIVSPVPGTTRDTIEEALVLGGIPLRVVDTAGLREAENDIEREGIRRTREHMEKADVHLYMVDASQPLHDEDRVRLEELKSERCVVVFNKSDLGVVTPPADVSGVDGVLTNLINGGGVDDVRRALAARLEGTTASAAPHAVISERHRHLLVEARREMSETRALLAREAEEGWALAANRLRVALDALGSVTGRTYQDELLDAIFSRFCIGK